MREIGFEPMQALSQQLLRLPHLTTLTLPHNLIQAEAEKQEFFADRFRFTQAEAKILSNFAIHFTLFSGGGESNSRKEALQASAVPLCHLRLYKHCS